MKRMLLTSTLEFFGDKLPLVFGEGLKDLNVLCIPTGALAEEGHEEWLPKEQIHFKEKSKSYTEFDINGQTQEALERALEGKDIVYVTGGKTFHLLKSMKAVNFKEVVDSFFERGGIYVSCSAGSIVTCPDISFIKPMEEMVMDEDIDSVGLGLVNFSIVPHMDNPHFSQSAPQCVIEAEKMPYAVRALNDAEALWIEGEKITTY